MRIERTNNVALVVLEAGKANAFSAAFVDGLDRLVSELEADLPGAVVMTGYGKYFSAGLDLPGLLTQDRAAMAGFMHRFVDVMLRWFTLPRPVVAAINGHAIAGGCVLALQADVRLMADNDTRIGLNEVLLGVGLPAVVIETLRCQVPAGSLLPIALEGRLLSPGQAADLGLVTCVPPDQLMPRAMETAQALAALPPLAAAHIKSSMREPVVDAVRHRLEKDTVRWLDTWFSDDAQARVRATVERLAQRASG